MSMIPFSNGTEFMNFREINCWKCKKDYDERIMKQGINILCDIEQALSEASVGDGTISDDIAKRVGLDVDYKDWDGKCLEFETRESE